LGPAFQFISIKTERYDIIETMLASYYLKVEPELMNLCHWYGH